MKKKIDRCRYNIANIQGIQSKPYCVWDIMEKREIYALLVKDRAHSIFFPPHLYIDFKQSSELTKDICKECLCFEPIARG